MRCSGRGQACAAFLGGPPAPLSLVVRWHVGRAMPRLEGEIAGCPCPLSTQSSRCASREADVYRSRPATAGARSDEGTESARGPLVAVGSKNQGVLVHRLSPVYGPGLPTCRAQIERATLPSSPSPPHCAAKPERVRSAWEP